MPILFRVCRDERQEQWIVLMAGQRYGEYLDKFRAILDAIETAEESRSRGIEVEVWDESSRLY